MNFQYISDNEGKTTGVFIPISEWNELKNKFKDIEKVDVPDWQSDEVNRRLKAYKDHSEEALDFDECIKNIEKDL